MADHLGGRDMPKLAAKRQRQVAGKAIEHTGSILVARARGIDDAVYRFGGKRNRLAITDNDRSFLAARHRCNAGIGLQGCEGRIEIVQFVEREQLGLKRKST